MTSRDTVNWLHKFYLHGECVGMVLLLFCNIPASIIAGETTNVLHTLYQSRESNPGLFFDELKLGYPTALTKIGNRT